MVHLESWTLVLQDEFWTMVCLNPSYRSIKNPNRRVSFRTKVFFSECVAFAKDMYNVWSGLHATFTQKHKTLDSFQDVNILKN